LADLERDTPKPWKTPTVGFAPLEDDGFADVAFAWIKEKLLTMGLIIAAIVVFFWVLLAATPLAHGGDLTNTDRYRARIKKLMEFANERRKAWHKRPFKDEAEFFHNLTKEAVKKEWNRHRKRLYKKVPAVIEYPAEIYTQTCEVKTWDAPTYQANGLAFPYEGEREKTRTVWADDFDRIEKLIAKEGEERAKLFGCIIVLTIAWLFGIVWMSELRNRISKFTNPKNGGVTCTPSRGPRREESL
jgi:hypothetical protein